MKLNPLALPAFVCGATGRWVLQMLWYTIDVLLFIGYAIRDWRRRGIFNRATTKATITQVIFTGIDALPALSLLALAIGISITAQLILVVQTFASQAEVVNVLSKLVALELGSLLTAIIIIGRSGSAIAVDLGNMKLNREVEGLEMLGINVNDFFVSPRLVGTAISQLVLAVYFSIIAVASGIVMLGLTKSTTYFNYFWQLPLAFDPVDLLIFLGKNLVFGLIIGGIACFHGLRVGRSATEVPQETQRAIVASLVMIFLLDGLLVLSLQWT